MYCTVLDVRNALTPGADPADGTTASSLSDDQIIDAVNEADARINTYLPANYTPPTETIQIGDPPVAAIVAVGMVRYWSRDIAAYLATLTYKKHQNVPEDDPVRLRYNSAMQSLLEVREGKIILPPDADTGDDVFPGEVVVHNSYEGTLFGPEDFSLTPVPPGMTRYQARTYGWW